MTPKFIDTHAHVNFSAYKNDADEVIRRALENDTWIVNVGSQASTSRRAAEMAEVYAEGVYAIVGLHPVHTAKTYVDPGEAESFQSIGESFDYDLYANLARRPKVVAIGEVGLDYHHFMEGDEIDKIKTKQREVFLKFIDLANEVEKPIMLHCWDAHGDLLDILTANPVKAGGVLHSFNGGFRTANKFIDLGYYIGLNGMMTYTPDFNRLIKELPRERIVSETDAPYLSPGSRKGDRNEPLYVQEIVKHLAEVRGEDFDLFRTVLVNNARQVLRLK